MAPGFTEITCLIAGEAAAPRLGTDVMLRRLTELLFIHVIRIWVEQQAGASRGWFAALRDPSISTALGLIHQSPERAWKVEELAAAVALSRPVFSARFTDLVGDPPIKYLTRWRMHRATRLLKNNIEVEKIAELLGYESKWLFVKPSSERSAYRRPGIESLDNQSPDGTIRGWTARLIRERKASISSRLGLSYLSAAAWSGGESAHVRCSSKSVRGHCRARGNDRTRTRRSRSNT